MKKVSLDMIAKLAGVSKATASRVLNNKEMEIAISDKTKEKVLSAAKQLDYMPSVAAQLLRTGKSQTIGVVGASPSFFVQLTRSHSHSFSSLMMYGLMEAVVDRRYHLILLTGGQNDAYTQDISIADGLLYLNRDISKDVQTLEAKTNFPKPVVYVFDYPRQDVYLSAPDHENGGHLATQLLLDGGHTRIGFVKTSDYRILFAQRQRGWEEALRYAGIERRESWVSEIAVENYVTLDLNFNIDVSDLTALVCGNDFIAQIIKRHLLDRGLRVPEDIAIVTIAHTPPDANIEPEFTMVSVPAEKVASEGVHMLIDLIEGKEVSAKQRFFKHIPHYGRSFPRP